MKIRNNVAHGQLGKMAPGPNLPPKVKPTRTRSASAGSLGSLVPVSKSDVYKPDAEDLKLKNQLESQFAKHRRVLAEAQSDPGEKSMMVVYTALLDMVMNLIPLAEEKYRENRAERAAYALNVYINQVREIQNDMRGLHDFSQTGYRIIELITHTLTLIMQNLVSEKGMLTQDFMLKLTPHDRQVVETGLHQLVQNQGRFINESMKSLRDQIMAQFVNTQPTQASRRGTVIRSR